jgi:hypothetical protein
LSDDARHAELARWAEHDAQNASSWSRGPDLDRTG